MDKAKPKVIAFDLEGPLSPNDHAYELMDQHPYGARIFEVLSRYDDLLALEREDYEPGDTLRLIVPFLVYYGVEEGDIYHLAEKATLTPGAGELIEKLKSQGWRILCLTTTYEQYARRIAGRVGIPEENVAATPLPLEELKRRIGVELNLRRLVEELIELEVGRDDRRIKELLDQFYYQELPSSVIEVLSLVRPVGGRRKVEALRRLIGDVSFSEVVVVGDSITDWRLLEVVREAGGLAVAFNANKYALPYANVGLAGESLLELEPVILSWVAEGEEGVRRLVQSYQGPGHIHWLSEGELPLELHLKYRRLLRSKVAELG